jgi:outer membrane protein
MKKFLITVSMVVLLAFGTSACKFATDADKDKANLSNKAGLNIGVLDLNKVMMDSPQLAAAKTKLKNDFDKREKDMIAAQKAFQADIEKFSKNSPTMKDADKKAAQDKIVAEQKKLQEDQTKFQNDLSAAQGAAMKDIVKKIEGIVNGIAADKKFDLVLAKAGTAFNKPELEITTDVINQMKK